MATYKGFMVSHHSEVEANLDKVFPINPIIMDNDLLSILESYGYSIKDYENGIFYSHNGYSIFLYIYVGNKDSRYPFNRIDIHYK